MAFVFEDQPQAPAPSRFVFEQPQAPKPAGKSIIERGKEAVTSGMEATGRALLDVYRALDPTQAQSAFEAGMAPIAAAGSPSTALGEFAGGAAMNLTEGMNPNARAAIATGANLISGALVPIVPIARAR